MNISLRILLMAGCGIWLCMTACSEEGKENRNTAKVSPPVKIQAVQEASSAEFVADIPANGAAMGTDGMVLIPGGKIDLGSEDGLPREKPVMEYELKPFYMDKTPVTVGQFKKFVESTGYVTQAEKFGNSIVHDMDMSMGGWHMVDGANWQYPRGPKAGAAPEDHPVTQVSYHDALAYCKWAGKRLPKEVEWEHAARNGNNSRSIYSWGEQIKENDVFKANYWQGNFPYINQQKDGYLFTSPVGKFGTTTLGLSDMAGNVWEWCEDWYKMYGAGGEYVETTPGQKERVMRGGSFMCEPGFCHGYRVSGRSGTTPESALFHLGFRCVKDIET